MPLFSLSSYHFGATSLVMIAISLGVMAIGLWVWTRNIDGLEHSNYGKTALIMSGILFPIGLSMAAQSRELAFYWDRWSWAFTVLVPAAIFSFEVTHLGADRLRRWILPLYTISFIFAFTIPLGLFLDNQHTYVYAWGALQRLKPLGYLFLLYFIGVFLTFLRLHDRKRRDKSLPKAARHRYNQTFYGWVFGLYGSLDFLGYLGIPWPPTSFVFFLLWILIFGYGVAKYHLFRVTKAIAAPTIIESMPGALFVVDTDGVIVIVNPYASKLTEVASTEMLGRRVTEFIPKAAGLVVEAKEHPPLGPLRTETEAVLKSAGGGEHPVAIAAMPIIHESGTSLGTTIIATDIGQMQRQVAVIKSQKAELEKAVGEMRRIQEQLIGRELKMIELKKEIEQLKKK